MTDNAVAEAQARVDAARAALAERDNAAVPSDAQLALDKASKVLTDTKARVNGVIGELGELPEDALERTLALAEHEAAFAPFREELANAYADFSVASHNLAFSTPPPTPNIPVPGEVTQLDAHTVVMGDVSV